MISSNILVNGSMRIINTTVAFFQDTCGRHDVAIRVSQKNDDGQFPITTRSMFVYNTSTENLIFNGQPNLDVVNPSKCGGKSVIYIYDLFWSRLTLQIWIAMV